MANLDYGSRRFYYRQLVEVILLVLLKLFNSNLHLPVGGYRSYSDASLAIWVRTATIGLVV